MHTLNNRQLRKLKALAQKLEPVARIGKAGLSDALVQSIDMALDQHELIKVRFEHFKEQKQELIPVLLRQTRSSLVTGVGHVVVLFRAHADPSKRKVLRDLDSGLAESLGDGEARGSQGREEATD